MPSCDIITLVVNDMNTQALWHQAKTEYSYAYDEKTLHIVFRSAKQDIDQLTIIYGDPFNWVKDTTKQMVWKHEKKIVSKRYETSEFDYYFIEIKPENLRTKYAFLINKNGVEYLFGAKRLRLLTSENALYQTYDLSEYFNYPYLNHEDLSYTPKWVKETIWYQIFPDRFYRHQGKSKLPWGKLPVHNHELYGGNLKGVIQKLPYLKDLGINGIYFTPIFESPSAHKYDIKDYFKIDPQFGTNADLKVLVQKAHEIGIKVVLDGVLNHAGYDHPFFQDVIKNGEHSQYKDCFFIDRFPVVNFDLNEQQKPINYFGKKLNYRTFALTPFMPKWNTSNKVTATYLLDSITYWIKEYDIDGWRLDVSNEVSHDFLRQVKQVSRQAKPDTFIFGENWDASYPWLLGDQLDAVMNYELCYPVWKYLEHRIDLSTFIDMMTTYFATTPKHVMENMFNLIGTHDTVRIKRRLKDDARRVKLAFLLMFLSAGAPNIYYGDEVGLTGEHDPDNRRCMPWNEKDWDTDFFDFTKSLIRLRKQHPAFSTTDFHFISHDILVFEKRSEIETILVLMNNQDHKVTLTLNNSDSYLDLFTNENVSLDGKIRLEAYDFLVLQKENV